MHCPICNGDFDDAAGHSCFKFKESKRTPEQAIGIGRGTYCPSCACIAAKMEEEDGPDNKVG